MRKKLLTLEDLVLFCSENKLQRFSAEESGYQICVQIPSIYAKDEEQPNDSLLMGTVKLLHTNRNRNGSNVTKKAAEKCMPYIQYKPLLANFTELENGDMDFTSHDMEFNEDGSINYLEHQIGCFTSDKPYMEYDEEKDRYYIFAKVAIPREYSAAAEIIERKGGTKISAELAVNSMSYDAKAKELILEDIEVMGATCLGTNPDTGLEVQEGMEGARLDIADFSAEKNSVRFEQNDKLIELLESLNNKLESFNILNTTKGGNTQVNKFDELLTKYEKTVDDITFEYEGLSDEELELAFSEAFEEPKKKKIEDDDSPVINSNPDAPNVDNSNDSTNPDEGASGEGSTEGQPDEGNSEPTSDPTLEGGEATGDDNQEGEAGSDPDTSLNSLQYSVTIGDTKKEFAISLAEKQFAIYCLINDTYSEMDNDFYDVDVYEESKEVVMHGWYSGKHYKQTYKTKKDVYSLIGDRVEVFAQYLTSDEITKLDNMKTNYASIEEELSNTKTSYTEVSEKLAKYEAEPEKIQVLESEEYSSIADKVEFEELKKQENHFDLTVEEIRAKADQIIVQYAKAGALTFAANNDTNHVGVKNIPIIGKKTSTKRSRYGGLGKQED